MSGRAWRCSLLLLLACSPQAPAPGAASPDSIRVAAAADLRFPLEKIVDAYTAATGTEVKVTYGSSGRFFAQISNGAPFDVFLSADVTYPRRLVEAGLAVKESEVVYAVGRLVIWAPDDSGLDLARSGMKALSMPSVKRLAVANPEHAPYGKAAAAAIRTAALEDAVKDKLVLGENVAQAAQFVQSGNADVGLIPLSLALDPAMRREGGYVLVPVDSYPRMDQGGVVISASAHPRAAGAFVEFLKGAEARAILAGNGFELPAGAETATWTTRP
jgi:molybdate transport system substrate-binding protein